MEKCKVLIEDYVPDLLSSIPENHLEIRCFLYKSKIFSDLLRRKSQLKYFSGDDDALDPDKGGTKMVFQYGVREEMITEL